MPSTRRVKVLGIALILFIFTILYFTNGAHRTQSRDFYSTTVAAMNRQDASDQEITQKLDTARNEAQQVAGEQGSQKHLTPSQDPEAPAETGTPDAASGEKSVAGRKKMKGGEKWDMASGKEAGTVVDKEEVKKDTKKIGAESKEEHDIEVELNSILKKGLIIIFSKSYCQYSKKAKSILLDKYTIVPAPFVVELDQHPLGPGLQAALVKSTGRRTVPNVLINGRSIGGGDEVEGLDTSGELIQKITSMGGNRVMEAKLTET